jgi:hypothetical protein
MHKTLPFKGKNAQDMQRDMYTNIIRNKTKHQNRATKSNQKI